MARSPGIIRSFVCSPAGKAFKRPRRSLGLPGSTSGMEDTLLPFDLVLTTVPDVVPPDDVLDDSARLSRLIIVFGLMVS